jgi:hypothetical protein
MNASPSHRRLLAGCLAGLAFAALPAHADPQAIGQARALLAAGNAKGAYEMLVPLQDSLSGTPEFDYLLGVAALDSNRIEEAIIAFERVLALMPNHAGAQMDLARAYYAAGSFDLAEAAFVKLRASNPPTAAQEAINRYLEAINARKHQTQAGWTGFGELGLGYDSNITGVPVDFGSAAAQSFNLAGIEATGNSIKRQAGFLQGGVGAEYSKPLTRGWSVFAGGEARGRAYRHETDFNLGSGELRAGAARNDGADQWRATVSYLDFHQKGAAPGEPQPTNDRRMASLGGDWKHALSTRTQVGATLQFNSVRFPDNSIEDFNQVFAALSWLRAFETKGVPMLYLTAFASDDRARHEFFDGTTKSKNLFGVRSYLQYSLTPKLQAFNALAAIHRRDKDDFARSTLVERGRDTYGEASVGLHWEFRDRCALRVQYAYSGNRSNIDIYDFNRHEVSSTIRCDVN